MSHLARLAGTNEFALKKGFKQVFGVPVFQFLQKLRMAKAAELLQTSEYQVSAVALAVGYENLSAFTRAFRLAHGVPPSEWRKTPFQHK
ncbi:MAG: helix-turn-helix transcriptional regulator [Lewinellaceae bacterium]|nr:helix-turn-helix transcriptional regulator [Lewinellaceae bacterium]